MRSSMCGLYHQQEIADLVLDFTRKVATGSVDTADRAHPTRAAQLVMSGQVQRLVESVEIERMKFKFSFRNEPDTYAAEKTRSDQRLKQERCRRIRNSLISTQPSQSCRRCSSTCATAQPIGAKERHNLARRNTDSSIARIRNTTQAHRGPKTLGPRQEAEFGYES